ncbi:hypothetical protein [Hymenobacter bucti]|uniref:Phage tail tape measure protein n=1 Tax=Hymenobacter bucti TaxID=1844114 RepID=A0ABW4QWD4_9BACT
MADNTTNEAILFEVRINSEQYKAEQKLIRESLGQVTLDIEKTRAAQVALKKERDAGKLSDAQYAQQSVKLREELNQQRASQRELEKGLRTSQQAYNSAAGSVDQLKARAAELTTAYNAMGKEERTASEAGQLLTAELLEVNKALLGGGVAVNDFRRNVGNYPKGESLAPLIQQLVKLEELQKSGILTAEQAAQADQDAVGFKQRIAQAGAQEGKSYEDTTALVKSYGDAIRPATAALVQLEQEQQQVVESGKATSEQVAQIGFRFGQAQKSIKDATDALKEVPAAAEEGAQETKSLGAGLLDAAQSSNVLGGAVEVLSGAKEKYTTAVNLAKAATSAEVGVLGLLKLALLATGLGLFVVVLGSVVAFLTKTQAGTDFLNRKMAALGAVTRSITSLFVDLGGKMVAAAEDPKQAFSDLVDFIETNLGNRLKAFGVLLDAVGNRDFSKLVDGTVQLTTGITNATAKAKAFTQQVHAAADSAERLAQMERELQRAEDDNIATNKTLLNQVERLKNVRDNEFNTIQQRQAANEAAFQVEMQRETTLTKLASQRVELLRAQIAQEGGRDRVSRERFQELKNAENELADIQEDAAGKQNELITNRYQLEQEALDKSIERKRQALAVEAALLNKQLPKTQEGSDEELNLLQRKLKNGYEAELNVKKLTVDQKRAIDLKYETDSTALLISHQRQAAVLTLQAEQERNNASLAANKQAQSERAAQSLEATQEQLEEEYQLQTRAAGLERELALASLNQRADNTAAELHIRAEASQKLADLNAGQADADRQRRAKEFSDEAQHYTLLADAMLAGRNQAEQLQAQASEEYKDRRVAAVLDEQDARLALVTKGSQEEANILLDAENKIKQIRADSAQAQLDLLQQQITKIASVVSGSLSSLAALQDADSQAKLARLDAEMNAEGVSAARKAVLEKQKLRVEQQAAEQRKRIAKAEAVINLGAAILQILKSPAAPFVEPAASIIRGIEIAAATATAAAQFRAIDNAKFEQGGVLRGPSHAQGGIPLFSRRTGQHLGAEAEGDEIILTKGVYRNPWLRAQASALNVAGGGRPFYQDPMPAERMARYAAGGVVSSSAMYLPQVRTGGVVQATTAPIDYDLLTDMMAAKLGPAFVSGARSLPAPQTNITDLRERIKKEEYWDSQTDIS